MNHESFVDGMDTIYGLARMIRAEGAEVRSFGSLLNAGVHINAYKAGASVKDQARLALTLAATTGGTLADYDPRCPHTVLIKGEMDGVRFEVYVVVQANFPPPCVPTTEDVLRELVNI